jgi:arginase
MSFQVCPPCTTDIELTTSGGQARSGVDLGPNRLIKAGIIPQISNLGWEVHYDSSLTFLDIPYNPLPVNSPEATEFAGDKPVKSKKGFVQKVEDPDIGRMKKPRLVSAVCERVGEKVGDIAKKGWLPLTLGGDHSLVS